MIGLRSSQPNMRLHLILIFRLTWIMGNLKSLILEVKDEPLAHPLSILANDHASFK